MQRRDFLLKAGLIGGGGLAGGSLLNWFFSGRQSSVSDAVGKSYFPMPGTSENLANVPGRDGFLGVYSPEGRPFQMKARKALDQLGDRAPGVTSFYEIKRDGRSWYNPVIRVQTGERLNVSMPNELDQETIIHWHGLKVDWNNDGHPSQAVGSGESYDYDFRILNRAGTYWYHPHPHGNTGEQVVEGMAGLFIVEDEDDRALRKTLDLELGVTDLPIVIQDRIMDSYGRVDYELDNMEGFLGYHGDAIFTNYMRNSLHEVETRIYRLRLLNGSNSRNYRLAFTNGSRRMPFYLVGVDGGFLESPLPAEEVFLSPGERIDLLVDFSQLQAEDEVALRSLEFDPMIQPMGMMGGMGMMGNMMGGFRLPAGDPVLIERFRVTREIAYDRQVPDRLSDVPSIKSKGSKVRRFSLSHRMMQWLINGHEFQMTEVVEEVNRGETEIWEIRNSEASQPHPMHLHGFSFQVLERQNSPARVQGLAVDSSGRQINDMGMKDTVLVWPGETVRLAIDFSHDFAGDQIYLFHCHMLEHSDRGMMINYKIS